MNFEIGSLVSARGRDWVVLAGAADGLLKVRPVGGNTEEITGIYLPIEPVAPSSFPVPNPEAAGDSNNCRLLRDAARFSLRSGIGPFRCFGRLAFETRPYQLVPMLMALRMDTIRLLIADDVGIGKTVEAALIARELLDRGEITSMAVLCPVHLAEQWQSELLLKFNIDAALVLPGTAARLERDLPVGRSLFEEYPFTVISMDYIKSERRKNEFIRACPDFVIVDEAHTCSSGSTRSSQQKRNSVLTKLSEKPERHMVLVTATPFGGNEEAFKSLLRLLKPELGELPDDLSGKENEQHRRNLARHFVQRRRVDITNYMSARTPFPEVLYPETDPTYKLSEPYKALFQKVLGYAREMVKDESGGNHRKRIRWWSALALLRSLGSSPAAAVSTLKSRSATASTESETEADDIGNRLVFDTDDELDDGFDAVPGAGTDEDGSEGQADSSERKRLMGYAREAEKLKGKDDTKLISATKIIRELLADGYNPIVFCRFIPTAEYLADHLKKELKNAAVECVTGLLQPSERKDKVAGLSEAEKRVLVCTDCLSEGINLQEHFDAVFHYDLAWNPTRHEQREGRVDRYGQKKENVKVLTYYGIDNQIDGLVLDILIKKYQKIKKALGISVPIPVDSGKVMQAIMEGILLRDNVNLARASQMKLFDSPTQRALEIDWEAAGEKHKLSRTMFAQKGMTIGVEDVARELTEMTSAIGTSEEAEDFMVSALGRLNVKVIRRNSCIVFDPQELDDEARDAMVIPGRTEPYKGSFLFPAPDGSEWLHRTHPMVEGLAAWIIENAFDSTAPRLFARRCGAIYTKAVQVRTSLVLYRSRFQLIASRPGTEDHRSMTESVETLAFRKSPLKAELLTRDETSALITAIPSSNMPADTARDFIGSILKDLKHLDPEISERTTATARELEESHRRVRDVSRARGRFRVEPLLPVDILGVYLFLPESQ